MDLKQMALEVIEILSCGDFIWNDDIRDAIYKFSHIGTGRCPHPDWEEELKEQYDKFREGGLLTVYGIDEHPKGGDPDEWPPDLRVREVPNGN